MPSRPRFSSASGSPGALFGARHRGSCVGTPRADPEDECSSRCARWRDFSRAYIGWNRMGVLLSLAIIAVAAVVLFHMLRDIDVDEVIAAVKATEWRHIAAAALFVAGGYFTLDLLRLVRAAHDRAHRHSLSHRRAVRLHQLFDRPQYRRHRVYRRRGALPHLFGTRPQRRRGRQDLLRRRSDLLARQCHRAGPRRHLHAAAPPAPIDQLAAWLNRVHRHS